MNFSRTRRRVVAWLGLLALAAGTLAAPLAHALAMRAPGAIGMDICSVAAGPSGAKAVPSAPGGAGHASHHLACDFCTGAPSPAILAPAPDAVATADAGALHVAAPADFSPPAYLPSRDGRPRAPPTFVR